MKGWILLHNEDGEGWFQVCNITAVITTRKGCYILTKQDAAVGVLESQKDVMVLIEAAL